MYTVRPKKVAWVPKILSKRVEDAKIGARVRATSTKLKGTRLVKSYHYPFPILESLSLTDSLVLAHASYILARGKH